MSLAPTLRQLTGRLATYIDTHPNAPASVRQLESDARRVIVELDRIDFPPNILAFTAPAEVVEAGRAFVAAVAANFPECPECHGGNTFATDVETREVVDGELVVTPVKAWDCGDCHYAWIPEEA